MIPHVLAQIPDPSKVIDTASEAGWMAAMLCFVFIVVIGFLVWLVRTWILSAETRETRMAKRIDDLETFIQREMLKLLGECKEAFVGLTAVLELRPCLMQERGDLPTLGKKD